MARQVTINYEDGSEDTVALKPKHLIAAERLIKGAVDQHGIEATFMAAWKATRSSLKFDAWLDTVENLEEVPADEDDDEAEVDPTPPAPSLDE